MRQFFRSLLGKMDEAISDALRLSSWGDTADPQHERWIFYVDRGRTIGIVGTDGRIHTLMGYHSVRHYYEGDRLVRRIPVRKDLKPGERLATWPELIRHQRELREQFANASGIMS